MNKTHKIAVCAGSFDPVTLGHVDMIERAAALFDKVYVLVLNNTTKKYMFTPEQRRMLLECAISHISNAETAVSDGMLVDFAAKVGACAIVKGVRSGSDFDYELQLSLINSKFCSDIDTVLLPARGEKIYLCSAMVRDAIIYGRSVVEYVSQPVADMIESIRKA